MANFQSLGRSNYFAALPRPLALLAKLFQHDIQVSAGPLGSTILALHDCNPEILVEEAETEILFELGIVDADNIHSIKLLDIIHVCIPPASSIVWIQIGNEKFRYLVGEAFRIDDLGNITDQVNLNSIYREGEARAEY